MRIFKNIYFEIRTNKLLFDLLRQEVTVGNYYYCCEIDLISDKIKREFFQAVTVSIRLHHF